MKLREELRQAILGKLRQKIDPLEGFFAAADTKETILAVLVSGRHLLLEGPPGTGKTTLAKILASLLGPMETVSGCRFNCNPLAPSPVCPDCRHITDKKTTEIAGSARFLRIQGSPELMPEDLIGDVDPVIAMQCGIHDPRAFLPGRIQRAHRKLLFIDELNRVPERTQNTLIQVLEEGTTTLAGFEIEVTVETIVIATQNPQESAGVDRVSETLADRFERVHIGYPTREEEIAILQRYARKQPDIAFDPGLVQKVVEISQATRHNEDLARPASVRASIATYEQAQAIARLSGRREVGREDIQKAAMISLQGRTGVSSGSPYYDNQRSFYEGIIKGVMG